MTGKDAIHAWKYSGFTCELSSPPSYTVITGKRPTGEWPSLRTNAIHLPHSSDGFQARDERIIRRSHHAWRLHALLCKAMNYRCLKSNRMHMKGALGSQTRRQRSGARKQPDSNPVEWKTVKVQRNPRTSLGKNPVDRTANEASKERLTWNFKQ